MLGESRLSWVLAGLLAAAALAIAPVQADVPDPPADPPVDPGAPQNGTVLEDVPSPPTPDEAQDNANAIIADLYFLIRDTFVGPDGQPLLPPDPPQIPDAPETPDAPDAEKVADDTVIFVTKLAEPVTGLIPSDPVKYIEDTIIKPGQELAEEVTPDVTPQAEAEASDGPEPAGFATADIVPQLTTEQIVLMGASAAAATVVILWLIGSSGSVAGGASTASGLSKDLRRLLPFASPLFTRFERETVLGHPKREALYALILQDPGVSLQALCEATGLSRTAVTHHLRLMELQHIVVSKRVGRSRHYYENGGRFGREQKEAYAVLQNGRSKQVAEYIRTNPGTIQKQLCDGLGIQASIAHWHVRRLREAGLIEEVREGRTVRYLPGAALQQVHALAPAVPTPLPAAPAPAAAPQSPAPTPFAVASAQAMSS